MAHPAPAPTLGTASMQAQRSLLVTTLDPFPAWPRVHQLAAASAHGADYRHAARDRRECLAVIQLGLAGMGRVWLPDGRQRRILPGEALIFRTGVDAVRYGLAAGDGPWRFVYAELAGDAALTGLGEVIARHGVVVAADAPAISRLVSGLADRGGVHHAVWDAGASARIAGELLAALVPPSGSAAAALARRAIAWLSADLAARRTVAAAAAALGVGRERLTRAMRAALGEPPALWLRRRRLAAARQLLAAPDAAVAVVARRVGYASTAQFVRAFRARYGCTPGAARGGIAAL